VDQAKTSSDQKENWVETQEKQWLFCPFIYIYIVLLGTDQTLYMISPVESMQAQDTTKENIYNSVVVFT